jgi:hypothetical protein
MIPLWLSPDCYTDKHTACSGDAWDHDNDEATECGCMCHEQ